MIRESLQQNTTQIQRQRSRSLRVTLDRAKAKMPIRAISTYAPHNGHAEETRHRHWEDVQELLNKTCKQHLIIWGADANGELGNKDKTEEEKYVKKERNIRSIIGPYTRAQHTERGNGANLHRICRRQQMIPMATWRKPRLLRQDKWRQQPDTTTKENWEKENRENI